MPEKLMPGGLVILVDEEDAHLLELPWRPQRGKRTHYARRSIWDRKEKRPKGELLHRVIMQAGPGDIVDHVNRNGLDCRRSNMRFATPQENAANRYSQNTTGYRGVYRCTNANTFRGAIRLMGRQIHLGTSTNPEELARIYDEHARFWFGEFAVLNFPGEDA